MAYKDISRGVRLKAEHDKYIAWLEKDTAARQTAYASVTVAGNKVKTDRLAGYVVPFDANGSALVYIPTRLISPTQNGRGAELAKVVEAIVKPFTFTQAEVKALTAPNVLDLVKKFKPAKVTLIQRVQTVTEKKASRITGRLYYRHENDSVTASFGKKVAADTYDTAMAGIKVSTGFAAFTGATNPHNKFRFVPEGV
ncbi:MAG: hypothetical protein ACR2LR_18000 [Hassallia sp.]